MTLDEIGIQCGTDKSSLHHDYLHFYERYFSSLRERPVKILEVGILNGASLATWEAYFPDAQIVGVDINPRTKRFQRKRVAVELIDQSNVEHLVDVGVKYGPFDIIIEDGSHMWEHQVTTMKTLFPFIVENGIYIAEDLQTNYGVMANDFRGIASSSCVEFLKRWIDLKVADALIDLNEVEEPFLRTYGRAVQSITFYRHACLIQKARPSKRFTTDCGLPIRPPGSKTHDVNVSAHVGVKGDVFNQHGYVHFTDPRNTIQSLAIDCADAEVEYRVRLADGNWTEWVGNNCVLGTRGESKALRGLAVKLKHPDRTDYEIEAIAKFTNGSIHTSFSGENLYDADGSDLVALQVNLSKLKV